MTRTAVRRLPRMAPTLAAGLGVRDDRANGEGRPNAANHEWHEKGWAKGGPGQGPMPRLAGLDQKMEGRFLDTAIVIR